jgi:polar amino acid transport system substrate-binding protein
MVAVLSLVVTFVVPQPQAQGLTVEKTTAKPNQSGSSQIIGGIPTRITWEATVGNDEEVKEITLVFPEGTALGEGAANRVTVLEGSTRLEVPQTNTITSEQTNIVFDNPVGSGLLIRVEMSYVALPEETGEYTITGTYIDGTGTDITLDESPAISVISFTTVQKIQHWLDQQPWVESWNSVLFLKIFLNPQLIVSSVPTLFKGWLRSLGLVLFGFPLAIPIGLAVSFLRMAKFRVVRFFAAIYVNVIRGTPLFLQIYIAFFGLPFLGVKLDSYVLGVLVLAMNSSAYLAEIFRAGIQSIHKGQFEASASLGMNPMQTMFSVILPQTVRRVIPTATSEFILLYKDTSLLAAVGVMEQMMFAKSMVASTGNMTPYIVSACYYLLVTLPLTKIIAEFEKKLAAAEGHGEVLTSKKKKRRFFGDMGARETLEAAIGDSGSLVPGENSTANSTARGPANSTASGPKNKDLR